MRKGKNMGRDGRGEMEGRKEKWKKRRKQGKGGRKLTKGREKRVPLSRETKVKWKNGGGGIK
jgi:hypothetical protein